MTGRDTVFSSSDEIAARALRRRRRWPSITRNCLTGSAGRRGGSHASREISTAVLSGDAPGVRSLEVIAERARELADAEQAIVLVPTDPELPVTDVDTLVVLTAVGVHAGEVIGHQVPVDGSTSGAVFRSGQPVITESLRYPIAAFTDVGQRSAVVMPLRAGDRCSG